MGRRLADKLVLISGASSGIGRAAALAFVERGARVVGLARSAERLDALSGELADPSRFVPLAADVTDPAAMERAAARVRELWGIPDVTVANAGIGLDALFTETSEEALRTVFEVNVFGLVRTVRPFVAAMVERGSGRILLVSSIVGKRGTPHYSAYSASKFALHGIADALRAELWGSGVTVGVVCPSSTATGFHERALKSGPAQRRVRPRTHSAESAAQAVVRMAESTRPELLLGFESRLLVLADALAPRLVDWLLWRTLTRRVSRPGSPGAGTPPRPERG